MLTTSFSIPRDGEIFIEQVLERCRNLINSGIWDGITPDRLDRWMQNFTTDTERYFGACVLDALIYRSEKQTIALMEHLFQRVLPDLLRHVLPASATMVPWLDKLREPFNMPSPELRVIPVLKGDDPPTKSGLALARLFRRHLSLNQYWMLWPWQIKAARQAGISQFLFVDDFLGTGDQFCEFAEQFSLADNLRNCCAVYAPLVAHKVGIKKVQDSLPEVHVAPVEVIDDSYSLFSVESNWFSDEVNSPASAKLFYDKLVARVQFPIKPEAVRGYGKLALAYAFHHATPDNSLPILWAEGKTWKPLLDP